MFSKFGSFLLILLLINLGGVGVTAAAGASEKGLSKRERKIEKHAAKVKKGVMKLGASKDSVVKLKLRDKTKLLGYVSKIGQQSFTVVDKNGESHVVEYSNTKQIRGNNLHAGVWVAIGVGAAVFVALLILSAYFKDS